MAYDRFVYWKEEIPEKDHIEKIIENFFNGAAKSIYYEKDRWYILLPSLWCHALKDKPEINQNYQRENAGRERWIEVCWRPTCIDIITRYQDEYTNAIANGLKETIIFAYNAKHF